jgi:hypothetical protein
MSSGTLDSDGEDDSDTHVVCESGHLPRTVAERWAAAPFIDSPPRTPEACLTHFL